MIVRAAEADALVLVPRGEGELRGRRSRSLPPAELADGGARWLAVAATQRQDQDAPRRARGSALAAAARQARDRAHSDRPSARPAAPWRQATRRRSAAPAARRSRPRPAWRRTTARRARARSGARTTPAAAAALRSRPRRRPRAARERASEPAAARARHAARAGGRASEKGFVADDEQRHHRQGQKRCRVAGKLLLRGNSRRGTSRSRATSQPASASSPKTTSEAVGQVVAAALSGEGGRAGPSPQPARSENAAKARAIQSQKPSRLRKLRSAGRDADVASTAAREQVDGREQEGQQGGDQRRAGSPSRARSASPGRRSSASPGRARGPGRAS